jgi:DNA-binding beta-propeller fold protein YncE
MNSFGNSVSYFPTPANTPVNTISSVTGALSAVFTPDGSHAYVVQGGLAGGNVVAYVRTSDNTVQGTIPVGLQPESIAITPDGSKVYVGNSNPDTTGPLTGHYKISVIQTSDNSVSVIDMGTDNAPNRLAVTPDGTQLWVVTRFPNVITLFDTATDTLSSGTNPISPYTSGGGFGSGIAFTPDGSKAYVSEFVGQEVTPINVAARTPGTSISMSGQLASWVAISPDGNVAYVTLANGTVAVIDTATNIVRSGTGYPITVGNSPNEVAFTPNGKIAYVANSNSASVSPIDTTAVPPVAGTAVSVGNAPQGVAIQPDQGPTADFTATPAQAGSASSFDGSGSTDPEGSVARYDWDWGDGTGSLDAGPTPSHTYAAGGSYNVTLTVTDDEGCSYLMVFTGRIAYCNPNTANPAQKTSSVSIAGIPTPLASGSTPSDGSQATAPTGQRAAALKKCKKKRGKARANCIKRAKKLPV